MHLILFEILSALHRRPAEAATLLARLDKLSSGSTPSLPALYRHLRRGITEGWIEVDKVESMDDAPGRPAQVYHLTTEGQAALRERARELRVFTRLALDEGSAGS